MADPHAWKLAGNRLFSPFRLFLAREAGIAFVLSPKVATTLIRDILSKAHLERTGAWDPSDGRFRILGRARRMPVAPTRDYLHFMAHPSDYRIYGIVRDPYKRLSSAWRNKFLDPFETYGSDISKYPRSMREGELKKAQNFAHTAGLDGAEPGSLVPFPTFVSYVENQKPGRRNHHWEDQWRITFHDELPYTQMFRLEDGLEAPMNHVLGPLGFGADWVAAQTQMQSNTSSVAPEGHYDQDLANRTARIFAEDFRRFGYSVDDWQGK